MSWHNRNRDLIALALAGALLLFMEFGLRLHPLYAIVIAAAVWLGVWMALAPADKGERADQDDQTAEATNEGHPNAGDLNTAQRTCLELEALHAALLTAATPLTILEPIENILTASQAMLDEANSRPEDFRYDRRALLHFLPQVVALIRLYQEGRLNDADKAPPQKRLQATLQRLAELFAVFRKRKSDRAAHALNVQIDVLEAQLRQEGLAPETTSKD